MEGRDDRASKNSEPTQDLREARIAAMWLMFLRAPGRGALLDCRSEI
jgi:hypothetical protein